MLQTSSGPPKRGSFRESVLFALILKKEDIETARTRVIVQSLYEKEGIEKTWKEFVNTAYPWAETAKKRETTEWTKRLAEEVARGPLLVSAQKEQLFKSRLKARVIDRELLNPQAAAAISRISKRLIPTIPLKT